MRKKISFITNQRLVQQTFAIDMLPETGISQGQEVISSWDEM